MVNWMFILTNMPATLEFAMIVTGFDTLDAPPAQPPLDNARAWHAAWRRLRHCLGRLRPGGTWAASARPARARSALELDEYLLRDVGAPAWLCEQARCHRADMPARSTLEMLRF